MAKYIKLLLSTIWYSLVYFVLFAFAFILVVGIVIHMPDLESLMLLVTVIVCIGFGIKKGLETYSHG